jgi:hypothetical protein
MRGHDIAVERIMRHQSSIQQEPGHARG